MYDLGMQAEIAGIERERVLERFEWLTRLGAFEDAGSGLVERVRRLLGRRRREAGGEAADAPFPGASLVPGSGKLAGR